MPRKKKEAEVSSEEKVKKPKVLLKLEDFDYLSLVDFGKIERAYRAVVGRVAPDSVEAALVAKAHAEGVKEDQELFEYVYRGLGGLVDPAKAKINRENEKKAARLRRSR